MLTFAHQIPGTSLASKISVLSYDENGWIGNVGEGWLSYPWGRVLQQPWFSVNRDENGLLVTTENLEYVTQFVSKCKIAEERYVFVLLLSDRYIVFDGMANIVEYIFNNLECSNSYGTLDIDYDELKNDDINQQVMIEFYCKIHNDVLYKVAVPHLFGWLSQGSKKYLSGKDLPWWERNKPEALWSCEIMISLDEPVNSVIENVFADMPWPDELLGDLECYEGIYHAEPEIHAPKYSDVYNKARREKWRQHVSMHNGKGVVCFGMFLNAPIVLWDDGYLAFPLLSDIYEIVGYDELLAGTVYADLSQMYLEHKAETENNT